MAGQQLLDIIWQVHQDPGGGHESALVGVDLGFEEGQHLQTQLLARWLDNGAELGGWKLGMTSGTSRNAMGEGVRPFGFVLADRIVQSGGTLALENLHRGQVENELCFLMGRSLSSDATRAEAIAAVAGVVPAFEVNQKRLTGQVSTGIRVADNLSNWGIVVGTPCPPKDVLSAMTVTLESDADGVVETVASPGHIDDHFETLATLARCLAAYGHELAAGQYVITGAYGKTPFAPGNYTGHFDCGVGDVTISLV